MHADESEDIDQAQLEFADQTTANDYLAGVSKGLKEDLHREMLIEQRNLLMKIRSADPVSSKYELVN